MLATGFVGSSQLNHFLTKRFKNEQVLTAAIVIQLITALIFFIGAWFQWYGLLPVILFLFVILGCAGIVYPNAAALCMAPFAKNAGTASALLGFIQIGIGGFVSAGAGLLPFDAVLAIAAVTFASVVVAVLILWAGKKKNL